MKAQANHPAIDAERQRQIDVEGYDEHHDKQHSPNTLIRAAMCYAMETPEFHTPHFWPTTWTFKHWKPKDRKRNLERSAALLLAAVDRISDELRKMEVSNDNTR